MMSIYLKILIVIYGYGALIHIADLPSFGHYLGQTHGFPFVQMPLAWKIATVCFAILDTIAAIGLWKGTWWGVACFLLAAASQVVMYTALTSIPTKFRLAPEFRCSKYVNCEHEPAYAGEETPLWDIFGLGDFRKRGVGLVFLRYWRAIASVQTPWLVQQPQQHSSSLLLWKGTERLITAFGCSFVL
jgi:hypothetical protein